MHQKNEFSRLNSDATPARGGGAPPLPPLSGGTSAPTRGVRFAVILPILLAISLGSAAAWWWKVAGARRARDLAAQQESTQAAEQKLAEAIARVPLVNAQANDCLRSGNWPAGLKMVDELLALVDAPELQETKVNLFIKAGRRNEAYELVLLQLQKQPDEAHLHFLAGLLAETVKGPKVALAHFGDACHLVPENKAYQVAWAKACLQAGMRDPAVATFNRLLADDPKCIPCWLDFASAFYATGQSPEAINLLQQAVKRFPDNSIYHFAMARILDRIGTETANSESLRTAASYYRRSLELQPKRNSVAAKRYFEITQTRLPPQLEAIRADEVPLTRQGASLFVEASINGVSGRFILDTGASVTSIAASSLARFKLVPSSQTAKVRTANGVVHATFAYADIDLGQHTIRQALIGVLPESFGSDCDGLFGLDSLRRFNAQLDTARGCLVVQDEQSEALFGN